MNADPAPRVPSFVGHRERMTAGQQRAWQRDWAGYGTDIADLPAGPLDAAGWFGRAAPLVLEIGSGMGESTATMAAELPELNHLAVEVYRPGLAQLLLRIAARDLRNLRLLRGDAVTLLAEHIAPASLRGVRAYFPDPWPKRKHHKRRLVQAEFVDLAASALEPGGTLHLATDWEPYAEQMLEVCSGDPRLRNAAPSGWSPRPQWRPVSKFEQRAVDAGRVVRDILFVRS